MSRGTFRVGLIILFSPFICLSTNTSKCLLTYKDIDLRAYVLKICFTPVRARNPGITFWRSHKREVVYSCCCGGDSGTEIGHSSRSELDKERIENH